MKISNRAKYLIRLTVAWAMGILAALAVFGIFYPVKIMDLQFTAVLERLLADFSIIAAVIFVGILAPTLIFGRFYCSLICPFGILQEIFALAAKKLKAKNPAIEAPAKNLPVKYFIAAITFGTLIGGSALVIRHIDPFTVFSSAFSFTIFGVIFTISVLVLARFKNRYFCTNICPAGAILGLISKFSIFKIRIDDKNCVSCGLCAKNCPSGCIDFKNKSVDNETCVKCLKCLSVCKKGAIKYEKPINKVVFSPKRREIITAAAVLILFGGAIKAGAEITKNFIKKAKNIILPPGAGDANRMANKCLNCNLCIKNCPNGILTKAHETFPAVHIDYSKGEGFCKYDCAKCGETCPSGAIKRLSLEDKQQTRIGMAGFNKETCTRCGLCAESCPKGAIKTDEKGEPYLNGEKCIGCGKCAKTCPSGTIEIFSINEQKLI